ncbi:MAG TPA: LPXTG cell wall anchor domain-containing protein [Egibacteraceae bacterium]|nr:LPXTG cell wall anchor domain-containing protein [Egibacteraceae bacterium]
MPTTRSATVRLVLLGLAVLLAYLPAAAAFAQMGDDEETVSAEQTEAPAATEAPETAAVDTTTTDAPKQSATATKQAATPSGAGANTSGPYDSTADGSPSGNGNGNGNAVGKPAAGSVGNADNKNPPGQLPDADSDGNNGYECDKNNGIGKTNPAHSGCKTTTPGDDTPSISLEKDGPATARIGDTITYTFAVRNTGDTELTNVHVTDPLLGGAAIAVTPSSLPAADSGVAIVGTATASYTVKAADVVDAKVPNTATAHGTPPTGGEVTATDNHVVRIPGVVEEPRKHTFCHATGSAKNPWVILTTDVNAIFDQGHLGTHHHGGRDIIPPFVGPDGKTYSQPDPWDAASQAIFDAGCEAAQPDEASISLVKDGPATAQLGDVITYTFDVENTGDVTLTNVHITDPLIGESEIAVTPSTLAPDATGRATATYTVDEADVVDDKVPNTATAHGTPPAGDEVTATDNHVVRIPDVVEEPRKHAFCHATGSATNPYVKIETSINAIIGPGGHLGDHHQDGRDIIPPFTVDGVEYSQNWDEQGRAIFDNDCKIPAQPDEPEISLVKDGPATAQLGDVITYTFDVENTGDVTLTNVHITDPLIGDGEIAVTPSTLAPDATGTATATYTVDEADVIDDIVYNEATVWGTPPTGVMVFDIDDHRVTVPTVVEEPRPEILLDKDGPAQARIGDVITYTFDVENTGDVTLTNVHITDPLIGDGEIAVTPSTLAPGGKGSATATYTVDAADVVDEIVENEATVHGTPPTGPDVTDVDDHEVAVPIVIVQPSPAITLDKDGPETARRGDLITYVFRVRNTGNVTLTNVRITDPLLGTDTIAVSPSTLEVGERGTAEATYTVTEADAAAGEVYNEATAHGTPPTGPDVQAIDDHTVDVSDIPEQPSPGIALEKSGPATARVGDVITYRFSATNTGDVTLTNVTISDDKLGIRDLAVTPSTLEPGERGTATATYRVTRADGRRGEVYNTAIVTGRPPEGPPVEDDDDHTTDVPTPRIPPRVPPEVPERDLPSTGMDALTSLLLAGLALALGAGLLAATRARTAAATPSAWSVPLAGHHSPPRVHRHRP